MSEKSNTSQDETIRLTQEGLAMIDEAEKSQAQGLGHSSEEAKSYVRQKAAEWLTERHQSA